ncbi:MAG: cupin-like domain-containing protein [Pseudomonadota bacterium]
MNAPLTGTGTSGATPPSGASVNYGSLPQVSECSGVDAASLSAQAFLDENEPLVLRGLVAHWPELKMDDAALLKSIAESASDTPIPFYTAAPEAQGRIFYNDAMNGFNFERRTGRLRDCCDWLAAHRAQEQAGTLYVGSTAVDGWWPGFHDTHGLELGRPEALCSLWLGNQTRIAAHYDFPRNLACVVAGERRFTLFPPHAAMDLHIGPLEHTPSGQPISMVDFANIDSERFPRFARALEHARVAELAPGDAIYIPGMWWHHVEALATVNLLVNYWWRDSALHLGSPQMALLHAALAIGQLGDEERQAWRPLFEKLVFERDEREWEHLDADRRGVLGPVDEGHADALRRQIAQQLRL